MREEAGSVVVVGSLNVDHVVTVERHPLPGETVIARSLTFLPGGKGANQAVAAARRGAATTMIGLVGDDGDAEIATSLLAESGVDIAGVGTVEGPTGLATVTVDAAGENTIVVVPGANGRMTADVVERSASVIGGAAVVILQGEIPADGIARAAQLATGRLLLNLAPVIELGPDVVRRADPLVVNEHEAALVLGHLRPGQTVPETEAELVAGLQDAGVPSVVITLGARGALVADGDDVHAVPSPRVVAVDSSGAGDAFVGALGAALAAGSTLLEAARQAVRVGAFTVQRAGTQASYPTLADELPSVSEGEDSGAGSPDASRGAGTDSMAVPT
ncbi:Ribokinase [Frondihabitans sp. 762G35]|uniref:ribokinase n=1 Tax=Frondihabitans sp. 762G35 TaxID=1446794 RepID=UPI000D20E7EC|nr:ribokinase [Frondihabitans sp. 762G35]ARC58297.1 Ribokinase [Frondihabitans sp. 762G35]